MTIPLLTSIFPRKPLLSSQFLEELKAENYNTPDMWYLERFRWQLMFVYNEFLPGHLMHHMLEDRSLAASTGYYGYTVKKYVMWKCDQGAHSYPLLLKVESIGKASPLASVKGFLWVIRPEHYYQLDRYMQNEVYYHRKRIDIDVPYREINNFDRRAVSELKHETVEAHAYIPIKEYWEPLLDHGRVFKPVKPFIGQSFDPFGKSIDRSYYYWTKQESV